MGEINAYNEALQSGQYEKPAGLLGKYDNVRRFWEDEQVGLYLRPFISNTASEKAKSGQGIRVLDIGCGSGDGLEVISFATEQSAETFFYKGLDINEGLLKQAQTVFGERPNLCFYQTDINEFDFNAEDPYDLYLANYGTLSHNTDEKTAQVLAKIANHGKNGAIICIDWLGRYAYEWQTLWTEDHANNQWMDYVISYIYSDDEEAKKQDLTAFPLRIVGRQEVVDIFEEANRLSGGKLALRQLADRSSFVGRHQDTAQYNPYCRPMRRVINRLFEPNVCTNLDDLLIEYHAANGFDHVNDYHHVLVDSWNHLVLYTKHLLEGGTPPPSQENMPEVLRRTIDTMEHVVKASKNITVGNPRAFMVEPQLGYCLRELEMNLQRGEGCGHGLVAIFEIVK